MAQAQKATGATQKPVGQNVSAARRVARLRRHARLRKKIAGTAETPRLVVNRSVAAHPRAAGQRPRRHHAWPPRRPSRPTCAAVEGDKKAHSVRVGQLIAERAKAAGIETVVFDRGGYTYGGRHRGAGRRGARRRAEVLMTNDLKTIGRTA